MTEAVEAYLAEAATEITTRIERLKASVGTGGLTIDDKGVLHLAPLPEAVPKLAF